MRELLGVKPGDLVWLVEENRQVRIASVRQAIRSAQELVRHYVPEGVSLAGELIAERRAEAASSASNSDSANRCCRAPKIAQGDYPLLLIF